MSKKKAQKKSASQKPMKKTKPKIKMPTLGGNFGGLGGTGGMGGMP